MLWRDHLATSSMTWQGGVSTIAGVYGLELASEGARMKNMEGQICWRQAAYNPTMIHFVTRAFGYGSGWLD